MNANSLKAVSETDAALRVANYIVLFGGADLTGEFFTPQTNFRSNYTDLGALYVDFEHGYDPERLGNTPNNVLGIVDWKTAKTDERGIFVERVLNRRAEYVRYLHELISAGLIGTSSEAIPGEAKRKSGGEIIRWPLMRDSLTVTPMEPRMIGQNVLTAIKSLASVFPSSKSLKSLLPAKLITECTHPDEIESLLREHPRFALSNRKTRAAASALWAVIRSLDDRDDARPDITVQRELARIITLNSKSKG